jgi:hypothetical protein
MFRIGWPANYTFISLTTVGHSDVGPYWKLYRWRQHGSPFTIWPLKSEAMQFRDNYKCFAVVVSIFRAYEKMVGLHIYQTTWRHTSETIFFMCLITAMRSSKFLLFEVILMFCIDWEFREKAGLNKTIVPSQRTGYIYNQPKATWSVFLCAFYLAMLLLRKTVASI